eukprot:324240-Prorocentrum_minimum.AAC.1
MARRDWVGWRRDDVIGQEEDHRMVAREVRSRVSVYCTADKISQITKCYQMRVAPPAADLPPSAANSPPSPRNVRHGGAVGAGGGAGGEAAAPHEDYGRQGHQQRQPRGG